MHLCNEIEKESFILSSGARCSEILTSQMQTELKPCTTTFTTTSLAGPIPSPVADSSVLAYTFKTTDTNLQNKDAKTEDLNKDLGPCIVSQKCSVQSNVDSRTQNSVNSSKCGVLYKNFGNGLSFCNTKYSPLDSLFTTYSWNSEELDQETVNEDILMEFIEDLDLQENEELPEIEINWADLTTFLNCMS